MAYNSYSSDLGLKHGTYTKTLRGTVNYVTNAANEFYELMGRTYTNFLVISTTMISLPDSVCMTIPFEV